MPSSAQKANNSKDNPANCFENAASEVRGIKETIAAYVTQQTAQTEATERKDIERRNLEKRTFWVIFAYTVVTLGLFCLNTCQIQVAAKTEGDSRAANILNQEEFLATQRAFVSISGPKSSGADDAYGIPTGIVLTVTFENDGATGTKGLHNVTECVTSQTPLEEPWSQFEKNYHPEQSKHSYFLGPHASTSNICILDRDDLTKVKNGVLFGYVLSKAAYYDRIDPGVSHVTEAELQYFVTIVPGGPKPINSDVTESMLLNDPNMTSNISSNLIQVSTQAVGDHNCADEECPDDSH